MSGRYSIIFDREAIQEEFNAEFTFSYLPRYNAYPSVELPVILSLEPSKIVRLRWGLIPYWAKNDHIAHYTFNAKAEKIFSTPSFRVPIIKRRCLVPANCFFEWRRQGGQSYPFLVYCRDQPLFALAGIWDTWMDPGTERIIRTFSIVTAEARPPLDMINDRTPVILKPQQRGRWLDTSLSKQEVQRMLHPYDKRYINAYPVSTAVNNPMTNDPMILVPRGEKLYEDDFDPGVFSGYKPT